MKVLTLEQAARNLAWFIVAVVLLLAGPRLGDWMIGRPAAGPGFRWLGVAVSVASLIPWLAYVGWGFTVADEYKRQILLLGTAIAFALSILYSVGAQVAADAHLVAAVWTMNLPIAFALWLVGLGISALYHRARE